MASPQSRLPAIVCHLLTLPRELIFQILDDLPLFKILQLACYDLPYLDECILNHYHYQNLFTSPAHLAETKAHFKVYHSISRSLQWSRSPPSPLSLNVSSSANFLNQHLVLNRQAINHHLHKRIYGALERARPHLSLLSQYSEAPIPAVWDSSNIELLTGRWNAISAAQNAINGTKSVQLMLLAAFKERYPDLLRWSSDVVDDRLKLNAGHVVKRFRADARRVMESRFMTKRLHVKYCFRHDSLPLVPYDWCLTMFWRMLERYPIKEEMPKLDFGDGNTVKMNEEAPALLELEMAETERLREAEPDTAAPDTANRTDSLHLYPPNVSRDIKTAIAGLPYVYTIPHPAPYPTPRTPRTKVGPYSTIPEEDTLKGRRESAFITPPRVAGKTRKTATRLQPHHGKEYEWLGAFLRCVEYMKGMLDEKELRELEKVEGREKRDAEGLMTETRISKREKSRVRKAKRAEKLEQERERMKKRKERNVELSWEWQGDDWGGGGLGWSSTASEW